MSKLYTYLNLCDDAERLAQGEQIADMEKFLSKVQSLRQQQESKKAYAAENPSKRTPKGASETTLARAEAVLAVLPKTAEEALTGEEIANLIFPAIAHKGKPLLPMQISTIVGYIEGAVKTEVVRQKTSITENGNEISKASAYSAYFLSE